MIKHSSSGNRQDDSQVPRTLLKFYVEIGPWERDWRYVRMTGKSETACGYPASLAVAMLSAIKRQMISDGAIRVGEFHFAGPVLDEGDYHHIS